MDIGLPSAAHFIYIPFMLLIGVVIGWVLGSRAAKDAYRVGAKRRERKRADRRQRTGPRYRAVGTSAQRPRFARRALPSNCQTLGQDLRQPSSTIRAWPFPPDRQSGESSRGALGVHDREARPRVTVPRLTHRTRIDQIPRLRQPA